MTSFHTFDDMTLLWTEEGCQSLFGALVLDLAPVALFLVDLALVVLVLVVLDVVVLVLANNVV